MEIYKWTMSLAIAVISASTIHAENQVALVSCSSAACDCGEPACGCEPSYEESCDCSSSCDCGEPTCGSESSECDEMFNCDSGCDSGCNSACGGFSCCSLLGDGELGDPWTLKGAIAPSWGIDFGGWTQAGYHSENTRLSAVDNDALAFNDHPDRLNLHQQWFWMEKVADGSEGLDWGFRADFMYGTDAAKTQAFGNDPGNFDFQNGWDRGGGYGYAMPQIYGEIAAGDLAVKIGHFYTLIGYEVVTAPDNFFYSHALTMFNSEPFTHTGAIATYSGMDNIELYGGWTAGWDTGFDQVNSGSNFLGGFSATLSDDVSFTYISTAGNFGARSNGQDGYSHSMVLDMTLTEDLNYVFQSDLLHIDNPDGTLGANDQVGVNQYLFYTLSDRWAAGARIEWWKTDGFSHHEMTYGLNYKAHANLTFRPEIRYDWVPSDAAAVNTGFANADAYNETTFGMDAIFTF